MSRANDPAFPVLSFHDEWDDDRGKYVEVPHNEGGLTVREHIAALMMTEMTNITCSVDDAIELLGEEASALNSLCWPQSRHYFNRVRARFACEMADALISELEIKK